jgi:hypothetical protein
VAAAVAVAAAEAAAVAIEVCAWWTSKHAISPASCSFYSSRLHWTVQVACPVPTAPPRICAHADLAEQDWEWLWIVGCASALEGVPRTQTNELEAAAPPSATSPQPTTPIRSRAHPVGRQRQADWLRQLDPATDLSSDLTPGIGGRAATRRRPCSSAAAQPTGRSGGTSDQPSSVHGAPQGAARRGPRGGHARQ